jgi:hypothetical protein
MSGNSTDLKVIGLTPIVATAGSNTASTRTFGSAFSGQKPDPAR